MAKFLDRAKAVSELTDLIKTAGNKLTLISAYVELTDELKTLLKWRDKHEKKTEIIFRKGKVKQDVIDFLLALHHVSLFECENLHVKCYFTEKKMIITSLNLLQSSIVNNHEMGVLVDKEVPEDIALYLSAVYEAGYIMENSVQVSPRKTNVFIPKANNNKPDDVHHGFCIRTGVKISYNLDRPFSREGYKQWSEWGNPFYAEKFCHFSGELSHGETNFLSPVLHKNWKQAVSWHGEKSAF